MVWGKPVSKGPSGTLSRTESDPVKHIRTGTLDQKLTSTEIRNTSDNSAVREHCHWPFKSPRFAIEVAEHPEFCINEFPRRDRVFQRGLQRSGDEHDMVAWKSASNQNTTGDAEENSVGGPREGTSFQWHGQKSF